MASLLTYTLSLCLLFGSTVLLFSKKASGSLCDSRRAENTQAVFKDNLDFSFYKKISGPSSFQLAFFGDNLDGQSFCFTWDNSKEKYKITTENSEISQSFDVEGWINFTITVKLEAGIVLTDNINGLTHKPSIKDANPGICYEVALISNETFPNIFENGNSNCSRYPLPSNATTITVSTTISTMAIITTATSASLPSEKTAEIVTTDPAQKTTTTTSSSASIITARTTKDTSPMTTERDAEEPSTNEGVTDVSDIVDGKPGNSQMITGNSSCKHLSWKMSLVVLVLLLIFT